MIFDLQQRQQKVSISFIQSLFQNQSFQSLLMKSLDHYIDLKRQYLSNCLNVNNNHHQLFEQKTKNHINQINNNNYYKDQNKKYFHKSNQKQQQNIHPKNIQISSLIEDISSTLIQNVKLLINQSSQQINQTNQNLMRQIQIIKSQIQFMTHSFKYNAYNTETPFKNFNIQSQIQVNNQVQNTNNTSYVKIYKDIEEIQERMQKISQISFLNSFAMQPSQNLEQEINQKINNKIDLQTQKIHSFINQTTTKIQNEFFKKIELQNKTMQNLICLVNQINNNPQNFKSPDIKRVKNQQKSINNSPTFSNLFGLKRKGK